MSNIKRLNLLTASERSEIYDKPKFSLDERHIYFSLNDRENVYLSNYNTKKTQIYFILQLGYFKAKQRFFNFNLDDVDTEEDVSFILQHYSNEKVNALTGNISRNIKAKQKKDILELLQYQTWTTIDIGEAENKICEFLKCLPKIQNALRQFIDYLDSQHVMLPTYRTLQDLFTLANKNERNRLFKIMLSLPKDIKRQLKLIIDSSDGFTQLVMIRADQKDFQYSAVKNEVEKAKSIVELYQFSKIFIPTLGISKNAVCYYAELAEQYAGFRLRQISEPIQWLQTICFIHNRYKEIMDSLIVSFIYHARNMMEECKRYVATCEIEHNAKMIKKFPNLAKFLEWFPARNEKLSFEETNKKAYAFLPEEQFSELAEFLKGSTFDKKAVKWQYYAKSSRVISLYLRPIITMVSLEHCNKNNKILPLLKLIKDHYDKGKQPADFKLIDEFGFTVPSNMIQHLKRNAADLCIDPHLFEYYVYEKVYHQIDRGTLFCNDSISYCDIEQDLIEDNMVEQADEICKEFGYNKIPTYCDNHLEDALSKLDDAWSETIKNIASDTNPGINVEESKSGETTWGLLYDSSDKIDDSFFKSLPKVSIADIMMFVGNMTNMWPAFSHNKERHLKRGNVDFVINAAILAEAFGFGYVKMSEMSDINLTQLKNIRQDHIRVNTLCKVNDIVNNYTSSLPIFTRWNLLDNKVIADADGQKISTTKNTIQSRYSRKYFGKTPGISIYTLLANHVAVNAKNIGPNEYEGHSLYDMIYGNKTDITIDMVTGDNHSLNRLNFVALDSINVDYVPSIKCIRNAANDLYSASPADDYSGIIVPKREVDINRITSQKRGIVRVLLSLILQENTQTKIIKKLNSHARYARLKAGLFEYNRILKSTHVLKLIDDMQLRTALRTARNRTESYHQLQGLISKFYNGLFRGKRIVDNRVSAHAVRLVVNCIVAYNSTILNELYLSMLKANTSEAVLEEFIRTSPIAWTHILFGGRYSFRKSHGDINIVEMVKILEEQLKSGQEEVV